MSFLSFREIVDNFAAHGVRKSSYTTCSSRFALRRIYKCLINRFYNPEKSTIATKLRGQYIYHMAVVTIILNILTIMNIQKGCGYKVLNIK